MSSLLPLLVINVDDPKSCARRKASVGAFKNFRLTNFTHSWIVELPPLVMPVIFDKVEVVAAICVTFMNTYCMQKILTFLVMLLNVLKDIFYVLFCLVNLCLDLLFLWNEAILEMINIALQPMNQLYVLVRHINLQGDWIVSRIKNGLQVICDCLIGID